MHELHRTRVDVAVAVGLEVCEAPVSESRRGDSNDLVKQILHSIRKSAVAESDGSSGVVDADEALLEKSVAASEA